MRTLLPLNKGMNKDVSPLYVDSAKGEVIHRKNCRVYSSDGSRLGKNVSIKGMLQVSAGLPSGTNKIIGYVEDKERDSGVFFNYNSNGNDGIYVFDGTNVINLGVPNGVLTFNPSYFIQAEIISDFCVFTDNINPPRKVNISGGANSLAGVDAYDIQLAVRPPSSKPSIQVATDTSRVINKLIGKTFQFAYFYIYNDYTYSVLSPYSDVVVSASIFASENSTYYDNSNIGNYVQVSYDLGSSDVRAVKLLAREGNSGNWFVVEEYDTGGATGTRTISFYNDVARKGLVEQEARALYSDVPLLAKSVVAVKNRIGLGNVLKGYDKTSPVVQYDVEYQEVSVSGTVSSLTVSYGFENDMWYIEYNIPTITEGDIITISLVGSVTQRDTGGTTIIGSFAYEYNGSYTVVAGDTLNDVIIYFNTDFYSKGLSGIVTPLEGNTPAALTTIVIGTSGVGRLGFVGFYDENEGDPTNFIYTESATRTTIPQGVSTFKSGSYYNVGAVFYDDYSRTSGVLSPVRVYIPHAGERAYADAYSRAKIAFTIPDGTVGVPSWAKYYRFAVTPSVNFAGVYPFVVGGDNIQSTFLDGKSVLALNMPSNFSYEFAKGDYLHLEVDSGSAITDTIQKMIIGTRNLIDISGTETAGFWLIVPSGDEGTGDYSGKLAYIYRPKDVVEDLVYYEDSNTYAVTSGVMQTLSGYVGGEDAWFTTRKFEWGSGDLSPVVEDFFLSRNDNLRAYSQGRVLVEFDTLGQIRLQDFVWSFNYLDNTKINGISTFNALNRIQLDEKDGQIQSLKLVGDVIKVIQDNKETSLYVGKAQYVDGAGNTSLVLSNNFIGGSYPSVADYGSRYAESIVRHDRDVYYWDGDRGQVIRSSANGQYPISDYGMKSEFLRIKQANPSVVLAFYDIKNDEYVITFTVGGVAETWSFKEGANEWELEYEYTDAIGNPPTMYGNIGELSLSFLNSSVWLHERGTAYNTFYGSLKPFSVTGVLNVYPEQEKCLRAVQTDSNVAFDFVATSPVANTRTVGQKTILYAESFSNREGNYVSPVYGNILGAGGVENLALLHSGNDMVGKYLELTFSETSSSELQLSLVTATFTVNR